MSFASIGDLSRAFHMRQASVTTKQRLDVLTKEMTTGRKADIPASTGGDLSRLTAIESRLTKIDGTLTATIEAGMMASAIQSGLGHIQSQAEQFSGQLLGLAIPMQEGAFQAVFGQAPQHLSSVVSTLNTALGGRYTFGGTETSQPPLADANTILSALRDELAGANSIDEITARVDAWFDAPAGTPGFTQFAYNGNDQALRPIILDGGEAVELRPNAISDGVRNTLKGMALGALMVDGSLTTDTDTKTALARQAGLWLAEGANDITHMRAQLGQAEQMIERMKTSAESEKSVMTIAYNGLTSADPYETASRLNETENQMQLLYSLTARLSRLSLADYLR